MINVSMIIIIVDGEMIFFKLYIKTAVVTAVVSEGSQVRRRVKIKNQTKKKNGEKMNIVVNLF